MMKVTASRAPGARTVWTKEQDTVLRRSIAGGATFEMIATRLGKTKTVVSARFNALRLTRPEIAGVEDIHPLWLAVDDQFWVGVHRAAEGE